MRWKTGAQSPSKFWKKLKLKNMISFGEELFRLCDGMVKQRTCHTNYAPLLAVLRFQFETFRFCLCCQIKIQHKKIYIKREVYEDLGWPWERFQEYIEHDLVCSMQSLHVELGSFWIFYVCFSLVGSQNVDGDEYRSTYIAIRGWVLKIWNFAANFRKKITFTFAAIPLCCALILCAFSKRSL